MLACFISSASNARRVVGHHTISDSLVQGKRRKLSLLKRSSFAGSCTAPSRDGSVKGKVAVPVFMANSRVMTPSAWDLTQNHRSVQELLEYHFQVQHNILLLLHEFDSGVLFIRFVILPGCSFVIQAQTRCIVLYPQYMRMQCVQLL
jgi:hypothetical protein